MELINNVYHICRKSDRFDYSKGYIGVSKYPTKRWSYHRLENVTNPHLRSAIDKYDDLVYYVIYTGEYNHCYELEKVLRPERNIGWNISVGGEHPPTTGRKGIPHSEETKKLLSKRKMGNCNVGRGESHHFYGKIGDQAIRFGTKGDKHPNHKGWWITPEGRFGSQALAAEHHKIAKSSVFYRCKTSKTWRNKGWRFEENE